MNARFAPSARRTKRKLRPRGACAGLDRRLRIAAPVTFLRLHFVPKPGAFLDAHPNFVMDDRVIDLVPENIDVARRRIYSNTMALFMARFRADRNGCFGVALQRHRFTSGRG